MKIPNYPSITQFQQHVELKDYRPPTKKGCDFLSPLLRGPWRLIYYEAYLEKEDAAGREHYLKSGSGRRFLKRQLRHYLAKHPLREAE